MDLVEQARAAGRYEVTCLDEGGNEVWRDTIANLITTVGKNDLWDRYLAGAAYTASFFLGLVNPAGTFAAADTMASHAGWTENTGYSAGTRPAATWSAAAAGAKSSNVATFVMTGATTIGGVFLVTNSTKGGTTGVLFSAGNFSGGDKPVAAGYSLLVTYSVSA